MYRTLPSCTRSCSAFIVCSIGVLASKRCDLEEIDVRRFEALEGSVDGVVDGGTGEAVLIDIVTLGLQVGVKGRHDVGRVTHESEAFGEDDEPFKGDVVLWVRNT